MTPEARRLESQISHTRSRLVDLEQQAETDQARYRATLQFAGERTPENARYQRAVKGYRNRLDGIAAHQPQTGRPNLAKPAVTPEIPPPAPRITM